MARDILDYSFSKQDPGKLKQNGIRAVMRYISPNAGKNLTAAERDQLRGAGIGIGLVWEWYAERPAEGYFAGKVDAAQALIQANALGFPADRPIYFAVDWDATEAQQGAINDYFKGVIEVLGDRGRAAYGGYWIIKRLFDAGIIKWGWQTYAWSGSNWDDRAQLRQVLNGQWGGQVDFNEAHKDDFGAWGAGQPAQNNPAPVQAPVPVASGQYAIKANDTFWGLEERSGWTHGTLQALNPGVVPERLQLGQLINVPGGGAPAPQPAAAGATYRIASGDTFWGLEARNGWAHGTLQGLNPGVVAERLGIGQVIRIPGGGQPAPAVATTRTYQIRSGDTFWALEKQNGWGTGTLQRLNPNAVPERLQIGQSITVPA